MTLAFDSIFSRSSGGEGAPAGRVVVAVLDRRPDADLDFRTALHGLRRQVRRRVAIDRTASADFHVTISSDPSASRGVTRTTIRPSSLPATASFARRGPIRRHFADGRSLGTSRSPVRQLDRYVFGQRFHVSRFPKMRPSL